MRWSPSALLALVALVVGGLVVADLRSPSTATDQPTPVAAGPAVGGAWYCAAGAVGEDNELQVLTAAPPGPDAPSDTEIRALHGTTTRVATQPVFPGSARLTALGSDEVQGDAVGAAVRWWDEPTATSRVWGIDGGEGASGIVSGPCASAPSPTWYVPGLSTAGGGTARLHLANPFATDASVSISFTTPTGPEQPILLENVSVSQSSVEVIELNEFLPRQADIGVVVESRSGRVVVEGVQQLDAAIGGVDAVALVRAAPRLAETWTIPWSLTDPSADPGEFDGGEPDEVDEADEEEPDGVDAGDEPDEADTGEETAAPPAGDDTAQPAAAPADEPTTQATDEDTATPTPGPTDEDLTEEPVDEPTEEDPPEAPTDDATDPAPALDDHVVSTESPGNGTASWIWVSNPGEEPAAVTVALHTRSGVVVPDIGDELLVEAGHILRVDLRGLLPAGEAAAGATVRSENGVPVVAGVSTLMQPEAGDPDATGYTSQLGWAAPDASWVVAGERMAGRTQVLHLTNPGAETAVVDVALWNGAALRRPSGLQGLEVGAGALVELDVTDELEGAEQSVAFITASEGSIVAGRHSVGSEVADWVAHTGVPASLWSGGDVVPPVDHDPRLLEGLGTSGGLQPRDPDEVGEPTPIPTTPTPTDLTPTDPGPTAPGPTATSPTATRE